MKVEGVVIKTLNGGDQLYDSSGKVVMAKVVSELFKEAHIRGWNSSTGGGCEPRSDVVVRLAEAVGTTRRFEKGLEKMRDAGTYAGGPEDIGPLMKLIKSDIEAEEKEWIMDQLWKQFGSEILSRATKPIPLWAEGTVGTCGWRR